MGKKRDAWDCENVLRYCLARPCVFQHQEVAHTNTHTQSILYYVIQMQGDTCFPRIYTVYGSPTSWCGVVKLKANSLQGTYSASEISKWFLWLRL